METVMMVKVQILKIFDSNDNYLTNRMRENKGQMWPESLKLPSAICHHLKFQGEIITHLEIYLFEKFHR